MEEGGLYKIAWNAYNLDGRNVGSRDRENPLLCLAIRKSMTGDPVKQQEMLPPGTAERYWLVLLADGSFDTIDIGFLKGVV